MVEAGFFDEARFFRGTTKEFLNDDIPADDNPRWKREMRNLNIKRVARGLDPL